MRAAWRASDTAKRFRGNPFLEGDPTLVDAKWSKGRARSARSRPRLPVPFSDEPELGSRRRFD
jgi:hypothetical protein